MLEDFASLFRVDLILQTPAQRLLDLDGEVVARDDDGGSPHTSNMAFLLDLRTSVEVSPRASTSAMILVLIRFDRYR